MVEKDQRVPADMVLLRTSDRGGSCFVRTDQLDGETDWKLRLPILQAYEHETELFNSSHRFVVFAEKPQMDIHSFIGTLSKVGFSKNSHHERICRKLKLKQNVLNLENYNGGRRNSGRNWYQCGEYYVGKHGSSSRECSRSCNLHWERNEECDEQFCTEE